MLFATAPTPLLALTEADYPMLLWAVVIAAMAAGPALKGWVDVVRWFKGDSLDATKLATKVELTEVMTQTRKEMEAAEVRLQNRQEASLRALSLQLETLTRASELQRNDIKDLGSEIRSLHRALGRTEGELDSVTRK